jgi:PIN domain nuclease of toxin-antitoxin system
VTVLDAYAVLAFLRGEAAAAAVGSLLGTPPASLTVLAVAEVLDHLVRLAGVDEDDAALDLAQLGLLDGIPVPAATGVAAGLLRARRYHRTRCAVSLADCVAAEVARARHEPLATSDPHLLDVCHTEGIPVAVVPGPDGTAWYP